MSTMRLRDLESRLGEELIRFSEDVIVRTDQGYFLGTRAKSPHLFHNALGTWTLVKDDSSRGECSVYHSFADRCSCTVWTRHEFDLELQRSRVSLKAAEAVWMQFLQDEADPRRHIVPC